MDSILGGLVESLVVSLMIFFAIVVALAFVGVVLYVVVMFIRMKEREKKSLEMVTLEIKMPKDNEIKIDAAEQLFGSFSSLGHHGFFSFLEVEDTLAFEMVGRKGEISFLVSVPNKLKDLTEKQIYAYYPASDIQVVEEPNIFTEKGKVAFAGLRLKHEDYDPIKVFKEIPTDSLSALTSPLSKIADGEGAIIQILVRATNSKYKKEGKGHISHTKKQEATPDEAKFDVDQKELEKINAKITQPGYDVAINLVTIAPTKEMADIHLKNLKSAFNQFKSDLNSFTSTKILFKYGFMLNFIYKFFPLTNFSFAKTISVLSSEELATIFHFPNKTIETPYIQWLKAKSAPVDTSVPQEGGTMLGYGQYRGVRRPVHLLVEDRRRHVYIIGKTGVGKSVLLEDMAIQDIKAGYGVCVIEPQVDSVPSGVPYQKDQNR